MRTVSQLFWCPQGLREKAVTHIFPGHLWLGDVLFLRSLDHLACIHAVLVLPQVAPGKGLHTHTRSPTHSLLLTRAQLTYSFQEMRAGRLTEHQTFLFWKCLSATFSPQAPGSHPCLLPSAAPQFTCPRPLHTEFPLLFSCQPILIRSHPFLKKLRWHSHNKISHFKVYNSQVFGALILWWNHPGTRRSS